MTPVHLRHLFHDGQRNKPVTADEMVDEVVEEAENFFA